MQLRQKLYLGLMSTGGVVTLAVALCADNTQQFASGVLGLSAAFTLFLAVKRSIAEPIQLLLNAAGEYSRGNFQYKIPVRRSDELGELSQAFNRMGEELERSAQQLEHEMARRQDAEHAARESREFLESALAQCSSGIMIVNASDLEVRFANRAALDLIGVDENEVSGEPSKLRFHDDSWTLQLPDGLPRPTEQLPLQRAIRNGETVHDEEFTIRNENGAVTWVSANAAPIRDDSGQIVAATLLLHNVTERRSMIEEIEAAAFHDPLTSLPNRASILRSIQDSIDRTCGNHFALLFMDFDRFKLINDSLGHEVGDELLRQIARRIQRATRATDRIAIPARLGGDEFVVLLDDLPSMNEAHVVAARLLDVLSQSYDLNGQTVCSTASIGVVTSEHEFESAADMLRDADLAMYQSKADGKGRFTVFDQSYRDKIQQRLALENDMRAGIPRQEFLLDYQPVVSLETGRIVAAEALAKWLHPQRGMLSAAEFITIADESGMIVPIGDRFINDACRTLAAWQCSPRLTAESLSVHVNLSRLQLLLPDLINVVETALAEHSVRAECLHLEIMESVIMHDPEKVIARINVLRKMGVKIVLDSFGTGYSSLSCLYEFPVDLLKIDRSFIVNAKETPEYMTLLTAVLNMADQLGLAVVAAGIEDFDQLAMLRTLGCKFGQGYLFARPMSAEGVARIVNSPFNVASNASVDARV